MTGTPWDELEADLAISEGWYNRDIRDEADPTHARILRFSLANKLSADWQKFLKAVADDDGLSASAKGKIGNGTRAGLEAAYANNARDPLSELGSDYDFFASFNAFRNDVDHGEEPSPSLATLEQWMADFRRVGQLYGQP